MIHVTAAKTCTKNNSCLEVAYKFFFAGGASFVLMATSVQALADLEGLSDENLTCRRQVYVFNFMKIAGFIYLE